MELSIISSNVIVHGETRGLRLLRSHRSVKQPFYVIKADCGELLLLSLNETLLYAISQTEVSEVEEMSESVTAHYIRHSREPLEQWMQREKETNEN